TKQGVCDLKPQHRRHPEVRALASLEGWKRARGYPSRRRASARLLRMTAVMLLRSRRMIVIHPIDVAAFQQVIQSATAIPAIAVGLQHQRVLAVLAGAAVIFREQVDQELALLALEADREGDF